MPSAAEGVELGKQGLGIVSGARIDHDFELGNQTPEAAPARQPLDVIRPHHQHELISRFPPTQRIQSANRIIRRIHSQLYIIHFYPQLGMPCHSLAGSLETAPRIKGLGRILKGVLGRYYKICAVEATGPGQIFEYCLMPDMQWIERSGVDRDSHLTQKLFCQELIDNLLRIRKCSGKIIVHENIVELVFVCHLFGRLGDTLLYGLGRISLAGNQPGA